MHWPTNWKARSNSNLSPTPEGEPRWLPFCMARTAAHVRAESDLARPDSGDAGHSARPAKTVAAIATFRGHRKGELRGLRRGDHDGTSCRSSEQPSAADIAIQAILRLSHTSVTRQAYITNDGSIHVV
jgi:hypothetical protein